MANSKQHSGINRGGAKSSKEISESDKLKLQKEAIDQIHGEVGHPFRDNT